VKDYASLATTLGVLVLDHRSSRPGMTGAPLCRPVVNMRSCVTTRITRCQPSESYGETSALIACTSTEPALSASAATYFLPQRHTT
jgi:hypothetical protein